MSATGVNKVVIPTAGRGTRFLPATKAVPKELLPVVDRPALEYVVEEAALGGLTDVVLVNGPGKGAIDVHFHDVGDEPFLVSLADMVLDGGSELVERMVAVREQHGGSVIALYEVPRDQIEKYGIAAVEDTGDDDVKRITALVEKPPLAEAPSNLAILGRYLLDPRVFELLRTTAPGRGGEIQLTDAIQALVAEGAPVHAVVFRDRVFDTGDKLEYLKVVVRLATRHPDLGPDFRTWLDAFVAGDD